MIAILS